MLHNCTITFSVLPYYIIIQKCTQNIAMYAFTGAGCTMIRSILDQSQSTILSAYFDSAIMVDGTMGHRFDPS